MLRFVILCLALTVIIVSIHDVGGALGGVGGLSGGVGGGAEDGGDGGAEDGGVGGGAEDGGDGGAEDGGDGGAEDGGDGGAEDGGDGGAEDGGDGGAEDGGDGGAEDGGDGGAEDGGDEDEDVTSPCNNGGAWASTCPATPAPYLINMNVDLRNFIVAAHNARRNRLALGQLPGYRPARRMAYVRWDADLARRAELNVKQCQRQRDNCHNTARFRNSGQNIAYFAYNEAQTGVRTNQYLLRQAITNWWLEHENANMAVINSYPSSWSGGKINRFAVMAQQRNIAVGCAAARFEKNNRKHFLVTCNYAVKNVVGRPVYARGPVGIDCVTGMNVNYPGLCKFAENYNI